MRAAGRRLVVGWLLSALVVLGMDGRLPTFLAWAGPGSLLALPWGRWCVSSGRRRCSTSRCCRNATGSPTTSSNRSRLWWRWPSRKPKPSGGSPTR